MHLKHILRGGVRAGAGRPLKEPTIILTFRILPEWKEQIKKVVQKEIESIKKANN